MTTTPDDRATEALPTAAALVVAVNERDAQASHRILATATTEELHAIAVVLAALVPADEGIGALLAHCDGPLRLFTSAADWTTEELKSAHAAFTRAKANQESPPPWAALGEKEYHRRRAERRRYLAQVNSAAQAAAQPADRSAAS